MRTKFLFPAGLSFKLLFLVIGVSFVGVLLSSLLIATLQRDQVIENAERSSMRLSEAIEAGIQHALKNNDWDMVRQVTQNVMLKQTVEAIRVMDENGIVRSSSISNEIGRHYSPEDPNCGFCHGHSGWNTPDNKSTILASQSGHDVLLNVNLIKIPPDCEGCDPRPKVEGILMIETPLTYMNSQLAAGLWRVGLSALFSFVLLVGLMLPAIRRLIIRPISDLTSSAREIGGGNLDRPIHFTSRDEFGELGAAFDAMRQQLKTSHSEVEHLLAETREAAQQATILYQLGMRISSSLELDSVADAVAEGARQMLQADIGLVGLLDEERQEMLVKSTAGARTGLLKNLRVPLRKGGPVSFLSSEAPIIIESYDPNVSAPHSMRILQAEGIVSLVGVPLRRGERLLGLVTVMMRERRSFTKEESQLLTRLAHHVVVAIENAQLYRQVRYLAALEERDRLARELHDNLAQALGYIKLKSAFIEETLRQGEVSQARESMAELKQVAGQAYTDVREAIFSLRTMLSPQLGLVPVLQEYLAEYRAHYNLDTRLVVDSEFMPEFSTEVGVQVIRVIQEALTNARKHAQASRVWVRFEQKDGTRRIVVQDDGIGFDPEATRQNGRQHCGLQIMRERMHGIGAQLEIDSAAGRGTRIIVHMPALQEK